MDEQWSEAQHRADTRKLEHRRRLGQETSQSLKNSGVFGPGCVVDVNTGLGRFSVVVATVVEQDHQLVWKWGYKEIKLRLNTPALYAIEVYCQAFMLDGVHPVDFEDDDVRIRFKFLDYACVEVEKREEVSQSSPTSTGTSSPWSSSPRTPGTPGTPTTPVPAAEDAAPGTPVEGGKVDGLTPSMRSQLEGLKGGSEKSSPHGTPQQHIEGPADAESSAPAESTAPASDSASSPTQSPTPSTKKRRQQRDPRYFDPKKLLKKNPPPPEVQIVEADPTEQPTPATEPVTKELETDSKPATETTEVPQSVEINKTSQTARETSPDGATQSEVPDDNTAYQTDQGTTEYHGEDLTEDTSSVDDRSKALFFENGKSLIFCTIPLNLLYCLPRYPLVVIFFRPPAEVLGIVRVDLSSFAEGIDSSIVLTKSIPLTSGKNDTFDIVSRGRTVGWADLQVRLSCFGPFLMHKIFVRDNPNEKETPEARTQRTGSNRLIVVQMSVANLGMVRNKSKLFVSKSNPSLVGRVTRDISNLPAIVCTNEHLIPAPQKPKAEPTIVEEEELEKEQNRRKKLSKFPQYKCIDDWEVVFNRQVIKDLIAKNRRPFQPGSPDRVYVESYFPELLPDSVQKSKSKSESESEKAAKKKGRTSGMKSCGDGPSLTYLALDEAWLDGNNLQRIRRKSLRPNVRTSCVEDEDRPKPVPSGMSSAVKLPVHTMPSMSHVAVNHFNMEQNDFSADSRVYPTRKTPSLEKSMSPPSPSVPSDVKNASNVAVFHFNPFKKTGGTQQRHPSLDATSSRQLQIFNTKHPRVDSTLEKFNPIPGKPYAIEIHAPERSLADKLVQAIRQVGDDVDAIGGDTKMLHSIYQDHISAEGSERFTPDHMKPGRRQTPEEVSRVLSSTADPVLIEVDRGVPLAVPARGTPYWEGHAPVCSDPTNCPHFIFLHPGFGYYGR